MAVETVLATLATLLLLGIVCGLPFGETITFHSRLKAPLLQVEDSKKNVALSHCKWSFST